uniref:Uncharacterized protein n=1 Tax=Amphimedon queenslandica TaxID=400682 RepID=A0A1X7VXJ2_AMPQE
MIYFHGQDYSRFARNIGILPLPPPVLPPPPTNNTCTATCGSDGLKVLNTATCQCICVRGIPAICPSPSPRASTRKTRKSKSKSKSKRRRERSHKTKSRTKYYGCPEYTKNGKLKKPKTPKGRSKSNIIIPNRKAHFSLCSTCTCTCIIILCQYFRITMPYYGIMISPFLFVPNDAKR